MLLVVSFDDDVIQCDSNAFAKVLLVVLRWFLLLNKKTKAAGGGGGRRRGVVVVKIRNSASAGARSHFLRTTSNYRSY